MIYVLSQLFSLVWGFTSYMKLSLLLRYSLFMRFFTPLSEAFVPNLAINAYIKHFLILRNSSLYQVLTLVNFHIRCSLWPIFNDNPTCVNFHIRCSLWSIFISGVRFGQFSSRGLCPTAIKSRLIWKRVNFNQFHMEGKVERTH